jgi:hypothetical protein
MANINNLLKPKSPKQIRRDFANLHNINEYKFKQY